MSTFNLPDTIPIFPLPGALLLPRARLPLHVFEPRYLALMDDCLKSPSRLIGMIQPRTGPDGSEGLAAVGCAGRLTGFSETADMRYMITLTGISRFRIVEEIEGFTPYRRCKVDWRPFPNDIGSTEQDPGLNRGKLLASLGRYFQMRQIKTDWSGLKDADSEMLINALSMLCPFSPEEKQALLESPSLESRRKTLMTLIEFALHSGQSPEGMLQ